MPSPLRIAACSLAAALLSPAAMAQTGSYPTKTVTMIVPSAPGGPTDREGRLYAQKLTEQTGQQFIIDYKTGARSHIGNLAVAKAPPDGYTLLLTAAGLSVVPAFQEDLPYDTLRDLAPVSLMSKRPSVLVVHPALPINNLEQYLAYARAKPNQINWGTAGLGGSTHLAGAWFEGVTGTKVTFIHYKGSAPLFLDLVSGRIQATGASVFTAMPTIRSGKVRPVAMLSRQRSALLPDLASAAEQGLPYDFSNWFGMVAPGRTPAAIISRLHTEIVKAARTPELLKAMETDGAIVVASTPDEFRTTIASEIAVWKKVVKENNITVEE